MSAQTEEREDWRLLPYDVGPSDRHFALSDTLARRARVPTVWAHSTDQPTLILGAGQRDSAVDLEAARARGISVVRRQAGGTSVFAGPGVLGVDVALPMSHPLAIPDVVEAYRWIGDVWMDAMRKLGVAARTVSVEEARARASADDPRLEAAIRMACFGSVSPYEVISDGRKLVGLAQVRRREAVLWQCGVHVHFDPATLSSLMPGVDPRRVALELARRVVSLDELIVPAPQLQVVTNAFLGALTHGLDIDLRPGAWSDEECREAGRSGALTGVTGSVTTQP
jgi:lipoate-protein ligase A